MYSFLILLLLLFYLARYSLYDRIMEKHIKPMVLPMVIQQVRSMVITILQQEIVPVAEDLIRKVVSFTSSFPSLFSAIFPFCRDVSTS